MANTTVDLKYEPIGSGGRNFNLPVDGGTTIFKGSMQSQLTATSMLVPATTALSGRVVGVATHGADNSAGADAAVRCEVHSDKCFAWANGTGANACSEATPLFSPVYAFDDHTIYDNSVGDTLPFAGYFFGMEPDGKVRVYIPPFVASVTETGVGTDYSAHGVRGASTADIPALATFTVAGVDGLTYVEGERILLKDQTAPAENGIYVVGVVAGGVAPLTRALDADGADEVIAGMVVVVSEGTVALDTAWKLDTNDPIVIGTTALTFTQIAYGYGAAGAMVAETIGVAAGAGTSAVAARIDHVHAMPAEGNGALIQCDTTAAGPGVAATMARSDHIHQIAAPVAPVETGEANAAGAAVTFCRSDHVHAEHSHEVRYVMTTDVPALGAFVITQDGVVGVEGDLVLLANQTAPAENGVYVLGAVAGTAPLTRVPWLPAAAVVTGGYTVHVNEGTLFASTNWFIDTAGAITIGTTAHTWYPECVTQTATLVAGTVTIATIPILSATRTGFAICRESANTSTLTVGGYHPTVAGANAVTAGTVGTGTFTIEACVGAGTINNADISDLLVTVINR